MGDIILRRILAEEIRFKFDDDGDDDGDDDSLHVY
jgi:hypothetical protein